MNRARPDAGSADRALPAGDVLGMRVDATSYADATTRILEWATSGTSAYVCVANVHMTMEAWDDPGFQHLVNSAHLVVPDGMPLVWALRALGVHPVARVRGPDLMRWVAGEATARSIPIALFGGKPEVVEELARVLLERHPSLDVRAAISPPFKTLTPEEEAMNVRRLRDSGARVVFVGLGCPKQERWMAAHFEQVPAVMIGVGAAFDFHTGSAREAPVWMQRAGLEWLFRFSQEPRRLWRRYLRHNPRFVWFFTRQLVRSWLRSKRSTE